jgi:hypothetical protein
MPSIASIEESFSSSTSKLTSIVHTKLNPNVRAKIRLDDTVDHPSLVRVDLSAKNWSISHTTATQDFTFRWNWSTSHVPLGIGPCKVNLTQNVPKGNWCLVPNPIIKLTKVGGFLGKNNVASIERDMMARQSGAALTLYAGSDDDDKRYKLKLSGKDRGVIQSLEGVARAKLWKKSLLHSIKVQGGAKRQVVGVKSRVRFNDDNSEQKQRIKSLLSLERKSGGDMTLGWNVAHMMHLQDVKSLDKVKTSVDIKVPLNGTANPSVVLGVKVDV